MGLKDVKFSYTSGSRGWKGDVPKMMLSINKLKVLGWDLNTGSEDFVRETVNSLLNGNY
ncbi:hypothetical protein [Methanococcoides methylutens]|uniref:hypothetical protein n=1 Tax=Methanococcoides methylutens TaxID=2226 RepID=UPI002E8188B1|nr:hypothetical protein [Methanococcoides methylutens]